MYSKPKSNSHGEYANQPNTSGSQTFLCQIGERMSQSQISMDDFTLLCFFNRDFLVTRTLMVSSLDEEVNCALKKGGLDFEVFYVELICREPRW